MRSCTIGDPSILSCSSRLMFFVSACCDWSWLRDGSDEEEVTAQLVTAEPEFLMSEVTLS